MIKGISAVNKSEVRLKNWGRVLRWWESARVIYVGHRKTSTQSGELSVLATRLINQGQHCSKSTAKNTGKLGRQYHGIQMHRVITHTLHTSFDFQTQYPHDSQPLKTEGQRAGSKQCFEALKVGGGSYL